MDRWVDFSIFQANENGMNVAWSMNRTFLQKKSNLGMSSGFAQSRIKHSFQRFPRIDSPIPQKRRTHAQQYWIQKGGLYARALD